MTSRVDRAPPAYVQVADYFRSKIHNGTLAEGARLPSIIEACRTFGVSRGTVGRAYMQLQVEGLAYSNLRGTYVAGAEHKAITPQARIRNAHGPMLSTSAADETDYVTAAEVVEAPRYVAELLDLDDLRQVVRREWVTSERGVPRALSVAWYPSTFADEVPLLLSTDSRDVGPLLRHLEARFGLVDGCRTWAHARSADAREANALALPVGTSIQALTWLLWVNDGADVLEYGESVLPPRHTLSWPWHPGEAEGALPSPPTGDLPYLFTDDDEV